MSKIADASLQLRFCKRPNGRGLCEGTPIAPLATKEKASQIATSAPDKAKKRAAIFGGRPLLETVNIIPS
jgi:hypothetical protein